jgi:hypothetical protein
VLVLSILFVASQTFAQNTTITLNIVVKDEDSGGKLGGSVITIYKNGGIFETISVPENGKIKKELQLGHTYDIKFAKDLYAPKVARLDTRNVPKEEQRGGYEFDMEVSLFKAPMGFNLDIMKEPAAKAVYMSETDNIGWDEDYIRKQREKIDAELKRVATANKADQAKFKEFEKIIQQGDEKVIVKDYNAAIAKYEQAQAMFPQHELPKQKIAKVRELMNGDEAAKKEEARYGLLMIEGDEAMNNRQWDIARAKFNEAKNMRPKLKEPIEKLAELERRMKENATFSEYDSLIRDADKFFAAEKYEEAIAKYKQASNILAKESYPKEQIAKAKEMMDKLKNDADAQNRKNKKYTELMSLGQKAVDKKDYSGALGNFEEAQSLKPEEQLPKDKIEEVRRLMKEQEDAVVAKEMKEKEDAEKAKKKKEYDNLVKMGDDMFKSANGKDLAKLTQSKDFYNQAQNVLPAEGYPKAKIAEIDNIIAQLKGQMDAAELARQMKEADRLKQEADMKAALAKQEEDALAERRRREEEEKEKKRKLDEALANPVQNSGGGNIRGSAAEDALDAFYREARRQRAALRADSIEQEKREFLNYDTYFSKKNKLRLESKIEEITNKTEYLNTIESEGNSWHLRRIDSTTQQIAAYNDADRKLLMSAQQKRETRIETTENYKKMMSALSKNDGNRRSNINQISTLKDNMKFEDQTYNDRAQNRISGNLRTFEMQKQMGTNTQTYGAELQKKNAEAFLEKTGEYNSNEEYWLSASNSKREMNTTSTESQKEDLSHWSEDKKDRRDENLMALNEVKYNTDKTLLARKNEAEGRGFDRREQLFEDAIVESQPTRTEIIANIQQEDDAITERSYDMGNKKVLERTVRAKGKTYVYRKIVSTSGAYYFKNGISITEQTWKDETTNLMTK